MEVLWQNSSLPVKRLQRLALLQPIDEARLRPATEQTKADPRRSVSGKARIFVIRGEAPSSTVSTTEHTETASRVKIITQ